jgi:hypothetical protein
VRAVFLRKTNLNCSLVWVYYMLRIAYGMASFVDDVWASSPSHTGNSTRQDNQAEESCGVLEDVENSGTVHEAR